MKLKGMLMLVLFCAKPWGGVAANTVRGAGGEQPAADSTTTDGAGHGFLERSKAGEGDFLGAGGGGGVAVLEAKESRNAREMLEGVDPFTCVPQEIILLQDVARDLVNNTARCERNVGILNDFLLAFQQYIALRLLLVTKVNRSRNVIALLNKGLIVNIAGFIPKVGPTIKSIMKTIDKLDIALRPMGGGVGSEKFLELQFQVVDKVKLAATGVHKVVQGLGFPVGRLPGQVSAAIDESVVVDCCVNVPDGFLDTLVGMNRTMGKCGFELDFEFPRLNEIFNFLADLFDFPILDRLLALIENMVKWIEAIVEDTLARLDSQVLLCCSPFAQEVARVVEFAVSAFNLLTCWTDSLITGVGGETVDVIFAGVKDIFDGFNDGIDRVNGAVANLNVALSFDFKFLFNNSTFPSLLFTKGDDGTCFVAVDGSFDIEVADGSLNASFEFIEPFTAPDADGTFDFLDIGAAIGNDCREAAFDLSNRTEQQGDCCALARIHNGLDPEGLELNAHCLFNFECESGRCDGGLGSTCRPKQPVGTSCNEAEDCETGLCFATAAFAPQTCRERKAIGEACSFPGECISGLICDDKVCRASLNLTLCSPCERSFDCESNRCPFFAGSCYPADGSPAPSLPFPNACECTVNMQCESGRCTASGLLAGLQNKGICMDKLANNSPCIKRSDCLSGRCDHRDGLLTEQICKPKLANCDVGVCNENNDCESGRCARLLGTCYPLGEQAPPGCKCLLNTDCKGTCDKGKCVDKFPIGHACLFNNECQSLRCDSRVCTVAGADRSPCNENTDCASKRCELSTRSCHPRNDVCEPCNEPSDCLSVRCVLGTCYPPTGKAPSGECSCVFGTDCQSGRCAPNGVCKDKLDVGEKCRGVFDCLSGRCDFEPDGLLGLVPIGTCQPELGVCEACNENSDCLSNRCAGVFGAFVGDCYPQTGGGPEGCKCFFDLDCASKRCEKRECKAKLGLGTACRRDQDCTTGSCKGDTFLGGSNGVCSEKAGVCEPCTSDGECLSGRCPAFQRTCYPTTGPAPDGCACSVSLDCQNTCIDGRCTSNRREVCQPCKHPSNCKSNRCPSLIDVCYPPNGPAPDGCKCAVNLDCQGFCTGNSTCVAKRNDCDACALNANCLSNRCVTTFNINQCYPAGNKAPSGCKCVVNLDCLSGRCDSVGGQLTCLDRVATGGSCNEDNDCVSSRCTGSKCAEKLENCQTCGDDGDCKSSRCPLALKQCYPASGPAPSQCKCAVNLDCISGRCDSVNGVLTCLDRAANGGSCNEDTDCLSLRCTGSKCAEKLDECQGCSDNGDCKSGRCPLALKVCYPPTGGAKAGCKCALNLDCRSGACRGPLFQPKFCL